MAFQIGIGDVVLMAQLSLRIAQVFAKGRKSAPAEFCEVESQLHALTGALEAVKATYSQPEADSSWSEASSHLKSVLDNCHNMLKHLEGIVDKYSIVSQRTNASKPRFERWGQSLARNWKKIEWTTEKGDLDSLRTQIAVYTNSLNLLLNVGT